MRGPRVAYGVWGRGGGPLPSDPYSLDLRPVPTRGFSLVELLIVLMLIGAIAAIALPAYMDSLDRARVARAIGDISAMDEEIRLYYFDNAGFPTSLADIGRSQLQDPYGNLYRYLNIADAGKGGGAGQARKDRFLVPLNGDFDLYSMGEDGESVSPLTASQSQDDVVRANDGGYIGLASEY